MTKIKVLYVDDEPDIREIAIMSLELDPDYEVRTAGSGRQALQVLQAQSWAPDIIILDLMMPDLDGMSLLPHIRALPAFEKTPVVFVTARTGAADVARLKASGAKGVITKPFSPMSFAETLKAMIDL